MSFILDALRKSELERQRQHGPGIAEFATAKLDGRPPWALAVIGVLLTLNVGVILFFLFRDSNETQASAPAAATSPQAAAPAATIAPAAASGATAAPPMSEAHGTTTQQRLAAAIDMPPASAESAPPSDPTLVPAPPGNAPSVSYDNAPPAGDALAAQVSQGLPELSMDLHIFSADRAKRAVFINGRRYTEGASIAEGPIVEEITSEGAVLNYRGHRFLLPRL